MDTKKEILSRFFGYETFRTGQAELIDAQIAGRDVFGIMPTGGGKSICYQIPALALDGVALIISPLISLMKDQVSALCNAGIPAAFINSTLSSAQVQTALRRMCNGEYKIVYVAPERLMTDSFIAAVQRISVSMVVVDEAHCISQWGQDFRPSYLQITDFIRQLPSRPVISAFTATATKQVQEDIVSLLDLRNPLRIITGYDRPNLFFDVRHPKKKSDELLSLLSKYEGQSGIIYCSTRKETEKVCQLLTEKGFPATRYHAGLDEKERRENQDDFIYDKKQVMVATNAFGMGIDKSNVSYVIHYNMPKSVEAYYQEAGRAGRDGTAADCIMLFASGDIQTARYFIEHTQENPELTWEEREEIKARDLERLNAMVRYCRTDGCFRQYLLRYFGENAPGKCGNCGNCTEEGELQDVTIQAQMIFSCIQRIHNKIGYSLGQALVARILSGSRDKRILELNLDSLTTYGIMKQYSRPHIRSLMDKLEKKGYLHTDTKTGAVALTQKAFPVLRGTEQVLVPMPAESVVQITKAKPVSGEMNKELFEALRELRNSIADELKVPPYVIFSNATLEDMAKKKPQNREEFLQVSGVGKYKEQQYGQRFLEVIREKGSPASN